ncbi:MAG: hypothetical protein HYY06_10210 [Deltaproteobacteria bacterium]|nr:hypothetical protein [Deltaproteobacteria bacterium]
MDSKPREDASPDGSIRIQWYEHEVRMGHWIVSPRVLDEDTGETLLDLWGTSWDATASFPGTGLVRLALRCYPGDTPGCTVIIDFRRRTFELAESGAPASERAGSSAPIAERAGSGAPIGELVRAIESLDLEQMIDRARIDASAREGWPQAPEVLRRLDVLASLAARHERRSKVLRLAPLFRSANTAADNSFAFLLDRIDRAARKLHRP